MVVTDSDRDGVFTVRRREGEAPFAELHAPRARGGRAWGVKYRDPDAPQPFGSSMFNACPPTRAAALAELADIVRVCSDYQLGLAAAR